MTQPLTGAQKRKLKGLAQLVDPVIKIGRNGITPALLASLDEALTKHELVKVRFEDFKEQKKELAPRLAEESASTLVTRVGNVAVLFRRNPDPAQRKISLS
jgi:RNA-binding protein